MSYFGSWPCPACVSPSDATNQAHWTPHVVVDTTLGGLTLIRCEGCGHQREALIEFLPERLTGEAALMLRAGSSAEDTP